MSAHNDLPALALALDLDPEPLSVLDLVVDGLVESIEGPVVDSVGFVEQVG